MHILHACTCTISHMTCTCKCMIKHNMSNHRYWSNFCHCHVLVLLVISPPGGYLSLLISDNKQLPAAQ